MDSVSSIFGGIKGVVNTALEGIWSVLPKSPFRAYLDALGEHDWLGYINWFIPVNDLIVIGETWLGAVALFYFVSIALRWIKAIE